MLRPLKSYKPILKPFTHIFVALQSHSYGYDPSLRQGPGIVSRHDLNKDILRHFYNNLRIAVIMRLLWTALFTLFIINSGIAQLEQITEEDVNVQTAYINAISPSLIGEEEEAIDRLEGFVEEHPTRHAAYFQLARLYKAAGQERECLNAIDQAVTLEPENEWYVYTMAQYQQDYNHWVHAGEAYEKLMRIQPDRSNYWLSAAHAYLKAGDPLKSLDILNELEEKIGLQSDITRKKFLIFKSLGKYKEAESEMLRLIEKYPRKTDYLMILANLYAEMGENEEELALYQKVLSLDSSVTEAKIRSSELESGSEGELLTQLMPIVKDPGSSIDLKVQKLIPFLQKVDGRNEESSEQLIKVMNALVEAHPRDAKSYTMLADAYFNTAQIRAALPHYEKAEDLKPNIASVWMQHIESLKLLDEHEKVIELAERAIGYFPNQIEFYLKAAEAELNLGQVESAREYLESSSFMVGRQEVFKQKYDALAAIVAKAKGEAAQPESYLLEQLESDFIAPSSALLLLEHHEITQQEWLDQIMDQAKGPMKEDYLAQIAAAYAAFETENYEQAHYFLDHSIALGASNDPRVYLLKLQLQEIEENTEGMERTRKHLKKMGYQLKGGEG